MTMQLDQMPQAIFCIVSFVLDQEETCQMYCIDSLVYQPQERSRSKGVPAAASQRQVSNVAFDQIICGKFSNLTLTLITK